MLNFPLLKKSMNQINIIELKEKFLLFKIIVSSIFSEWKNYVFSQKFNFFISMYNFKTSGQ